MKEIELLDTEKPFENGNTLIDKVNEIAKAVNMLITVHPKLEQRIKDRQDFKDAMSLKD